jgi:hypothetical protein
MDAADDEDDDDDEEEEEEEEEEAEAEAEAEAPSSSSSSSRLGSAAAGGISGERRYLREGVSQGTGALGLLCLAWSVDANTASCR